MPETGSSPVLTPEDHEFFLKNGYLVLKRAVAPEVLAAAVDELNRRELRDPETLADFTRSDSEAVDACVSDRILDAIGELFGPGYTFDRHRHSSPMPRVHQPEATWEEPRAHIDDNFPTIMPGSWAVGLFVFLTRVPSQGGAFILFPGSYRNYRRLYSLSLDTIAPSISEIEHSGPYREFLAEPGDAVLFHHAMGHTGSTNITNPQTRLALLTRYYPSPRVCPGNKPLEAMSTLEKANSVRYFRERFRMEFSFPICEPDARLTAGLQNGIAVSGDLRAGALVHFGGQTRLFFVEKGTPDVIRRVATSNLVDWVEESALPVRLGPIHSLMFYPNGRELLLTLGVGDTTLLLASDDLESWRAVARVPESRSGSTVVTGDWETKIAHGRVLFSVSPSDPARVQFHCAETWEGLPEATRRGTVAEAPAGSEIRDVYAKPIVGELPFALIADVLPPGGNGRPELHYATTRDALQYDEPLVPLPHSLPSAPRHLRIYNRAHRYWLVTYLRPHEGQERVFFGVIDWQQTPPVLRELETGAAFEEAYLMVGMK
jgi:hypothetical protein